MESKVGSSIYFASLGKCLTTDCLENKGELKQFLEGIVLKHCLSTWVISSILGRQYANKTASTLQRTISRRFPGQIDIFQWGGAVFFLIPSFSFLPHNPPPPMFSLYFLLFLFSLYEQAVFLHSVHLTKFMKFSWLFFMSIIFPHD